MAKKVFLEFERDIEALGVYAEKPVYLGPADRADDAAAYTYAMGGKHQGISCDSRIRGRIE